jgi:signal transduction histidine kinase
VVQIDPSLIIEADQQLIYSAISNLIQNALKYPHTGGKIQMRGNLVNDQIEIEVEDECGGLKGNVKELFKPFVQENENRRGLGLGLTIARRAIELNHSKVECHNMPGKGCTFKITLPKESGHREWKRIPQHENRPPVH